jgi:hypothetical protein
VAPRLAYIDKITGKSIEGVETTTLYRGVIPFIIIQILMVTVVYFVPQLVTHYKDSVVTVDPADVQRQLDNLIIPGLDAPGLEPMPPPRF